MLSLLPRGVFSACRPTFITTTTATTTCGVAARGVSYTNAARFSSTSSIDVKEVKRTRDQLLHTFTDSLRVSIITNTKAVRKAQELHKLGPIEAQLLGRTMSGVSLMASFLEGDERILAELRGNGPVNVIIAEAIQVGEVRGYIHHSEEPTTIAGALGDGIFKISKVLYNLTTPMLSVIELQKGDIESEFSSFMERSEQIPSALKFETLVDDKGEVEFSGGIIIQTSPKAPADIIPKAQALLDKHSFLNDFILKKHTLQELMQLFVPEKITKDIDRTMVDFYCRCAKGTFKASLSGLGHEELRAMQAEKANTVTCVNCNKGYVLSDEDFNDMHKMYDERTAQLESQTSNQ